jgi:type 2 lantibiotic biosynthesis protein LanM
VNTSITEETAEQFDRTVETYLVPTLDMLAVVLDGIGGLTVRERAVILRGAGVGLHETVLRKVSRVLVLELNAARITGTLTADDSAARWDEFVARTRLPGYWDTIAEHYPALRRRLEAAVDNRVSAAIAFAERFAADRGRLSELDGADPGELLEVTFGAGDSHRGGQTVVLVRCADGRLVYKPRPVDVDHVLAGLLARILPDEPDPIRVPRVLVRDGYGWAEHIEHRYCADEEELRRFYRNLGRWLAVTRLVGGTDLHQENLIAAGPVPVVVDCETLFTPRQPAPPSGYGAAVDQAHDLVNGSVLGTGLLPGRGLVLGWRGIDTSAIGSLPGQQPTPEVPVMIGAGTDEVRVGMAKAPRPPAGNHPSPDPVLGRYWDHVVAAFTELTTRLHEFDRGGELTQWLAPFAATTIRAVLRSTETYAELSRMLWHPASLHDPEPAVAKAIDLLTRHAANAPDAPADPYVIAAEVAELLDGDIPFFSTTPATGLLLGPRGTTCGTRRDLVVEALDRWRATDPGLDRRVIQAALVSAYLNEGWLPDAVRRLPSTVDTRRLDRRRRALAATIVGQVVDTAITGEDGTVSWVAPVLNPTGWSVQALSNDLYSGTAGVAVLLAGYLREQSAGRADEVPGVERTLKAAMRTMLLAEHRWADDTEAGVPLRPEPPGGYVGLGSRINGWLLLRGLGAVGDDALEWAAALAEQIPRSVVDDPAYDILVGRAGAIVPLLRLAEYTGKPRFVELAGYLGDQLVAEAKPGETETGADTACWPNAQFPEGIGGFAHGATGIGWALARLAELTHDPAHADTAAAAFAYEGTLYDFDQGGWRDLREENHIGAAWCHGGVGIGAAAIDLLRRGGTYADEWRDTVRVAAWSSWHRGTGWNHTLCHGDLGVWEIVTDAMAHDLGPGGLGGHELDAHMIGAVEEFGVVTGMAREACDPGLLPGAGGIAYQLLRLHPGCALPSVLLPDPGPARRR